MSNKDIFFSLLLLPRFSFSSLRSGPVLEAFYTNGNCTLSWILGMRLTSPYLPLPRSWSQYGPSPHHLPHGPWSALTGSSTCHSVRCPQVPGKRPRGDQPSTIFCPVAAGPNSPQGHPNWDKSSKGQRQHSSWIWLSRRLKRFVGLLWWKSWIHQKLIIFITLIITFIQNHLLIPIYCPTLAKSTLL